MKIAHFSDTHLGFSAYRKVDDESGINQREMDLYRAFERCVDGIIASDAEVVLHSGDLFDSVRPSNRAISFTLDQLIRLTDAGKEVVLIAGNHSAPKLRETGSVFRIFDHLRQVHSVYKGAYEKLVIGDLAIHAVPHADGEIMKEQLDLVKPDRERRYNVLMLHAGLTGVEEFSSAEYNEQLLPDSYLRKDMDYIALGHFHTQRRVKENSYYSGSTERLTFSEAGNDKGWMLIDLASGKKDFMKVQSRPMYDLRRISAKGMDHVQLMGAIRTALSSHDLQDAVVRLNVTDITGPMYRSLDFHQIKEWTNTAVHFQPNFILNEEENRVQSGDISFNALDQEYIDFLERYAVEGVSKEVIRQKGLEYLRRGSDPCE
jgi:DNA repair protein SbcD/Mre11